MAETNNVRTTLSREMLFDSTPEAIWPLLCPVREYDWIETWDCELIHSVSGVNELGCVFTTDLPTELEAETWVTSRFDPCERLEFVRTNSHRTIHFVITLEASGDGTRMTWTHHTVPLTEQGAQYVENKPKAFDTAMSMLEKMLRHYLETGEMLRGESLGIFKRITSHVHSGKTG